MITSQKTAVLRICIADIHGVLKACRIRGVDCIVAPYEADAEIAFLLKTGVAQAVITEDSDLLAFGCEKVCSNFISRSNSVASQRF